MSDMMNRPAPGGGTDAMSQARSPFNATDAAFAKSRGQVNANMSFGQYMESQFGIKWDDPLQDAAQKMAQKVKTASPVGKMQAMAGGGQPSPAGPQAQPQPQKAGLDALM